jgi:SAM-dependent methyltransferase
MKNKLPPILDVCCGPKGMWFDKNDDRVLFLDKRSERRETVYPSGKYVDIIDPDIIGDFTDIKQPDDSFSLVIFDPPHITQENDTGRICFRYGHLTGEWHEMLKKGFSECFRVLKPGGFLVFKWNECRIPIKEILSLTHEKPLFGHKSGKAMQTHWVAFMKHNKAMNSE